MTIDADLRECPIDGCDNLHDRKLAMCKKHWRRVPKDLQDEVYRTARCMWATGGILDTEAWTEALDAAVAAVELAEAEAA